MVEASGTTQAPIRLGASDVWHCSMTTRSAKTQHLSLGVPAVSRKVNERRLPIHPAHFAKIDRQIRRRIFLEHGYGAEFGATDDALPNSSVESGHAIS